MTKSGRYSLLSATNGNGKTVKTPFAGRLFKAQNTGAWVGTDNEDLTFILRKAVFETGTVVVEAKAVSVKDTAIEYNRLRLLSTAVEFADTASVKYRIKTTTAGSREVSEYQEIQPGVNADLTGRQEITKDGDVNLQIEITSKSKDISPMLDKQLLHAQVFKTFIEEYSEEISASELKPTGGMAAARYISKPVTLAEGFDSTGLEVKIDISRQIGTDAEVFCRVLARTDGSIANGIYDKYWVKNCVAIGLASSFLEPMEATSLMTSIMFIKGLIDCNFDEKHMDEYNKKMFNINEENMLFVRHHYTCTREDSEFWLHYKNLPLPTKLLELYDENNNFKNLKNEQLIRKFKHNGEGVINFNWSSWFTVHKGKSIKHKQII
jgi:hypothetical protein